MKYFKIILVLFLFLSCKNNKVIKPEKPDNLLSEKQMVDIIYDMSIMSGAKGVNKKLLEKEGINPETYIYELHNIDSIQFAESNNYYTYDLETYERVYAKVKRKLEADKVKFDTLVSIEKRKRDSINKVKREEIEANKKKDSNKLKSKKSSLKSNLLKIADTSQIKTHQ